jgi:hypothetical protein
MTNETPATFNEYRAAFAAMKTERDQYFAVAQAEAANRRALAEAVLGYDTGHECKTIEELGDQYDRVIALAEGMTK